MLATLDSLRRNFDIIQYHAIGSAPLAWIPRMFGHATVVSVRGLDWQRAKWGLVARKALQFGEWASTRCPTAMAVVSETLQRHYLDKHGRNSTFIPNAVIAGEFRPLDKAKRFGLTRDGFLLYTGRISPEKGVHTLLEALRPLPRDKKLVLAGGTSYSDEYIKSVKRNAWNEVVFLGRVDHETMEELYSNCYAFILPSVMEGLSIALLEALSFGACIITTDIPENLEVIGDAGLSFTPGDAIQLRELLGRILRRPKLVHSYRLAASQRVRTRPGWDEVTWLTEQFYCGILPSAPRRALNLKVMW